MQHPELYGPFEYALLVQHLWDDGDRAQAFFWYDVVAARTAALMNVVWHSIDHSVAGPDNEVEFPLMLRLTGLQPLQWAASDPETANAVAHRAFAYEARLPPPPGIDAAAWSSWAGDGRRQVADAMDGAFDQAREQRRRRGQYVGPWQEPGRPLDDAWR